MKLNRTEISVAVAAVLMTVALPAVVVAQSLVPNTKIAMKEPAIVVSAEADRASLQQGEAILVTVTVRNVGEVSVSSVVVRDVLPAGFTLVNDGASEYTNAFANPVASGNEVSATFAVRADRDIEPGTYQDAITVTATATDPVETHVALTVTERDATVATIPATERGEVLGAETTLPETGVGQLDVFMMLFGSFLVVSGVLGLRSFDRATARRRNHPA